MQDGEKHKIVNVGKFQGIYEITPLNLVIIKPKIHSVNKNSASQICLKEI